MDDRRFGRPKEAGATKEVRQADVQEGRSTQPGRLRAARSALLDDRAAALVRDVRDVFCEPTRSQIVRALSAGPLTVTDIASVVGRSKWATSQHLRVLRQDGFVTPRRRGRSVLYSLSRAQATDTALRVLEAVAGAA